MNTRWFRIKLGIIGLLVINGMIIMRKLAGRLNKLIRSEPEDYNDERKMRSVKRALDVSIVLQLILFLMIFILASFRFA